LFRPQSRETEHERHVPNAVAGVYGGLKSTNEIRRAVLELITVESVLVPWVAKLTTIFEKPTVLTLR
jgi:hypothetical protein